MTKSNGFHFSTDYLRREEEKGIFNWNWQGTNFND
jgi:hypothetical protein